MPPDSVTSGGLFANLPPPPLAQEQFSALLSRRGIRIERIVSTGQCSPPDFWYDQAEGEWVVLLSGAAGLQLEGETEVRALQPGDWLDLPPRCRHRVAWTHPEQVTVWLAVFYQA